jgi:hypothetical protein
MKNFEYARASEWIKPNGDSSICDSYEARFAELLGLTGSGGARENVPIKASIIILSARSPDTVSTSTYACYTLFLRS